MGSNPTLSATFLSNPTIHRADAFFVTHAPCAPWRRVGVPEIRRLLSSKLFTASLNLCGTPCAQPRVALLGLRPRAQISVFRRAVRAIGAAWPASICATDSH